MKKMMTVVVVVLALLVVVTGILFVYVRRSLEELEERGIEGVNVVEEIPEEEEREFSADDFKGERISANRAKLEMVLAYDLENNYPRTPDDVIRQYSEVYNVIYGNFIANPDLILELVKKQRQFFAQSLLEANSLEEQFAELINALNHLSEIDFYYFGHRQEETVYDPDLETLATIDVVHFSRVGENFRLSYLLEVEPETRRWKIKGWDTEKEESGGRINQEQGE